MTDIMAEGKRNAPTLDTSRELIIFFIGNPISLFFRVHLNTNQKTLYRNARDTMEKLFRHSARPILRSDVKSALQLTTKHVTLKTYPRWLEISKLLDN